MDCHCCFRKEFEHCCQPFISEIAKPETAEALMRSRYSAYATGEIQYLLRSTHPSTRRFHDAESIGNWSRTNIWKKLEIISSNEGGAKDKTGIVEFKAYFLDAYGQPQIHHERSNFVKELGKWFFVDGKIF